MAEKKPIPLAVVLAPLVVVIGIAGFVGFNLWRDYQSTANDDSQQEDTGNRPKHRKKHMSAAAEATVDAGASEDDDDLTNLPKNIHRKPVTTPVKPVTGTPAQRAYAGFKSAYDKLEAANETAAKKYRTQRLRLEDQLGSGNPANESKFVADCDSLKAQILEALRNPENQ